MTLTLIPDNNQRSILLHNSSYFRGNEMTIPLFQVLNDTLSLLHLRKNESLPVTVFLLAL